MSGKWLMLKAKKISSISILEHTDTGTQHEPRTLSRSDWERGRRGANCAMTRRGGRGARWCGRGGDKGRARGGHAARVNKAYLFLRYCDSAWTPSNSAKQTAAAGQARGQGEGVSVPAARQPKSPPGPRAVARPQPQVRAHPRTPSSPLALPFASRCWMLPCFASAFACRLFIEPHNQPTQQGK